MHVGDENSEAHTSKVPTMVATPPRRKQELADDPFLIPGAAAMAAGGVALPVGKITRRVRGGELAETNRRR